MSGTIVTRVGRERHQAILQAAREAVSMNAWVVEAIDRSLRLGALGPAAMVRVDAEIDRLQQEQTRPMPAAVEAAAIAEDQEDLVQLTAVGNSVGPGA